MVCGPKVGSISTFRFGLPSRQAETDREALRADKDVDLDRGARHVIDRDKSLHPLSPHGLGYMGTEVLSTIWTLSPRDRKGRDISRSQKSYFSPSYEAVVTYGYA